MPVIVPARSNFMNCVITSSPFAARKVFLASREKYNQILQETRANSAFNFEFAMSALGH
jgi:hypothetical protein